MKRRLPVLLLLLVLVGLFFLLDGPQWLSFGVLREHMASMQAFHQAHPLQAMGVFALVYVLVAALSLPGAALLTLLGGALFGLWQGLLLVSLASTLGATLAFLATRWLFHDAIQQRFARQLATVNRGMEQDGHWYLMFLRLVPAFPFFLVNWLMALTPIRWWTFLWVSQLAMLPGTFLYVNAGQQFASLDSMRGILSAPVLLALIALAVFPLLAKRVAMYLRAQRACQGYEKPARFDANVVVIGAGAAGLVSSVIASTVRARVILVERHRMGGDCLNTGCVPSKALLASARVAQRLRDSRAFGLDVPSMVVDFPAVMDRVRAAIRAIEPHDSVERFTSLGVECLQGEARVISPWEVAVGDRVIRTRRIVLASGARPAVPDIPGIEAVPYLTSDTIWSLQALPQRLLVIGGGPVGCEMAQAFARLGSTVTLVQRNAQLLPREDVDVAAVLQSRLLHEGVHVHTGAGALRFEAGSFSCRVDGQLLQVAFDAVLVATGREANTGGMGLEALGVGITPQGSVAVNEFMQTTVPTIYACGDVAGPYRFTHMAAHQAWYAMVNALFGSFRRFAVDYSLVPAVTYTEPEVASVGLNESTAAGQGIAVEVTRYDFAGFDRAIVEGETDGFIKVLTVAGGDRIVGVSIVGAHAGEVLGQFTLAIKHGIGLNKLLATLQAYPAWAESPRLLAGMWKRERAPRRLLAWVARYHRWLLK